MRSITLILLFAAATIAHAQEVDSSAVLFRMSGGSLRDSRRGPIAELQRAMNRTFERCGTRAIDDDGIFGSAMRAAIIALYRCPGFDRVDSAAAPERFGAVDLRLWGRVMHGAPPPRVRDRAFILSLSHEATDYDRIEWNYGTGDDRSALTWGPYGATVGWGNEVRGILLRVDERDRSILPLVFGDELETVRALMRSAPAKGYALLKDVYLDTTRRALWREKFRLLCGYGAVREEYDRYAFESDAWLRPPIRRLYDTLIPNAASSATEIDYAFFLDIAMHMSITGQRLAKAREAVAREERRLKRDLTPAERRRAIAGALVPSTRRSDRLGRNVVYYIDGIGEEHLTPEERRAWRSRTGRRASDCGLSDARRYYPGFLLDGECFCE